MAKVSIGKNCSVYFIILEFFLNLFLNTQRKHLQIRRKTGSRRGMRYHATSEKTSRSYKRKCFPKHVLVITAIIISLIQRNRADVLFFHEDFSHKSEIIILLIQLFIFLSLCFCTVVKVVIRPKKEKLFIKVRVCT